VVEASSVSGWIVVVVGVGAVGSVVVFEECVAGGMDPAGWKVEVVPAPAGSRGWRALGGAFVCVVAGGAGKARGGAGFWMARTVGCW